MIYMNMSIIVLNFMDQALEMPYLIILRTDPP